MLKIRRNREKWYSYILRMEDARLTKKFLIIRSKQIEMFADLGGDGLTNRGVTDRPI